MAHKQTSSGREQKHEQDPFRRALVMSGLLHVAVVLLFSISMPFLQEPPETPERVNVTLIDAEKVAERAKAPAAGEAERADPDKASESADRPDSPPKQVEPARPPQAPKVDMNKPPEPKQLEQAEAQKPAPKPAPSKPAPPEPEPEPEPVQEPEPQEEEDDKPDQKQKAQNKQDREKAQKQFQSVLKNLAEPRPESEDREKDSDETEAEETKDEEDATQGLASRAGEITMSEKQALRQQLSKCWNVLAGVKNAQNLVVRLRLHMNPDRTVKRAELLDKQRYDNNPQFRAAADSALRAVQNPQCSPLKLPPEKYDQWKLITIRFDPEQML